MIDSADDARRLAEAGRIAAREGRIVEARARLSEALALERSPLRLNDLAVLHGLLGEHAEAEVLLREAHAREPANPRWRSSLGITLLAQERLAEGFRFYDAWREIPDSGIAPAPEVGRLWSGEGLKGANVLIWGEEGFGDQIMYARFVPLLQAAGAQLIWACHPALARLVREGLGIEAAPISAGQVSIEGADYIAPTSRLPVVFMQTLSAPPPAPYLRAPQPRAAPERRIGLVTRGNPKHHNDLNRSLPAAAAAELLGLPGAMSLLPEDTGAEDFWDTAALIAGLDLVISVDTSVAHLAGALGKPVWLLLPAAGCDWRWGTMREDSAWYPSARLFRQTRPGDWAPVIARLKAELA